MVNRTHIYTLEDVSKHTKATSCWIVHNNSVYDVTPFMEDHPGGDDYILRYAGKDITSTMLDPLEHSHSSSAYDLLSPYQVGIIGAEESIVNKDFELTEGFVPEDTDLSTDYKKNQFLDLTQPLIMQVWRAKFSKSFYLAQVHQPRHLPHPARLFGPGYLEMFTRTPWYVVPLIWMPIALGLFGRSIWQQIQNGTEINEAVGKTVGLFLIGNFLWTLLEYGFHRFLFHVDDLLPDHPAALTLHFLMHGIHHYLPMDRLRLVMPPLMFTALSTPFVKLAHALFAPFIANGLIAGAFAMYVAYDTMHYALHHTKLPEYIKSMKSHHMHHHYKEPDMGFGVTSRIWDYVFDTDFKPTAKTLAL